jgi:signal transduction histidine kinase/FixJ family two-component response regulator
MACALALARGLVCRWKGRKEFGRAEGLACAWTFYETKRLGAAQHILRYIRDSEVEQSEECAFLALLVEEDLGIGGGEKTIFGTKKVESVFGTARDLIREKSVGPDWDAVDAIQRALHWRLGRVMDESEREVDHASARMLEDLPWGEQWCALHIIAACARQSMVRGEQERAYGISLQGLELSSRAKQVCWARRFESSLAVCAFRLADHEQATKRFQMVARQREVWGDPIGAAESWSNVGVMLFHQKNLSGAQTAWRRAVRTMQSCGNIKGIAKVMNLIAAAHLEEGDWSGGLSAYQGARGLSERARDHEGVITSLIGEALALLDSGRLNEAGKVVRALEDLGAVTTDRGRLRAEVAYVRARYLVETGEVLVTVRAQEGMEVREALADFEGLEIDGRRDIELRTNALFGVGERAAAFRTDAGEPEDGLVYSRVLELVLRGEYGCQRESLVRRSLSELDSQTGIILTRTLDAICLVCIDSLLNGDDVMKSLIDGIRMACERSTAPCVIWKKELLRAWGANIAGDVGECLRGIRSAWKLIKAHWILPGETTFRPGASRRCEIRLISRLISELSGRAELAQRTVMEGGEIVVAEIDETIGDLALSFSSEGQAKPSRWNRRMESLLHVAAEMKNMKGLEPLLKFIVRSLRTLTDAENAFIVLIDSSGRPRVEVADGQECIRGESLKGVVSETIIKHVLSGKRSFMVKSALDEEWLRNQPSIRSMSVKSLMVAPLVNSDELLGVIYVDSRSAAGKFEEDDLRLLELFAGQVAVSVSSSRLLNDLQRAYRSLADAHERLLRSEKLKVLGELASGVAHDFNNLLTAILMRAQVLESSVSSDADLEELRLIQKAASDGGVAVSRIQEFTRLGGREDYRAVDIRDVLQDCVQFTKGRWRGVDLSRGLREARVSLEEFPSALVLGNASELREVFTNIILNGLDAMSSDGSIAIVGATLGRDVIIRVSDEGDGIVPENLDRIFEPFFTTKGDRGNGLGLSVARDIVERHGGRIWIDSTFGCGSDVFIALRVADVGVSIKDSEEDDVADMGGGRVLVVDDDALVRGGLVRAFQALKCEVVAADSAAEAIQLRDIGDMDLLVSDYEMPGTNGVELIRRLRELGFAGDAVLMTGSVRECDLAALREAPGVKVLRKPFRLEDVRRILAKSQSRVVREQENSGSRSCGKTLVNRQWH